MERNHFSDLLRELLIRELQVEVTTEPELLLDLLAGKTNHSPRVVELISKSPQAVNRLKRAISFSKMPVSEDDPDDPVASAKEMINEVEERFQSRICPLFELIEGADEGGKRKCGQLVQALLRVGVNPAGNDLKVQSFWWGNSWHHWTELFDFVKSDWKEGLPLEATNYRTAVISALKAKVGAILFSRLYFNIEAAGLGQVCIIDPKHELVRAYASMAGLSGREQVFKEICNSSLEYWGESFRYEGYQSNDWVKYENTAPNSRNIIQKVAGVHGLEESLLGTAVFSTLDSMGHYNGHISTSNLGVKVSIESDPVWQCTVCHRPHLSGSAKICTGCYAVQKNRIRFAKKSELRLSFKASNFRQRPNKTALRRTYRTN